MPTECSWRTRLAILGCLIALVAGCGPTQGTPGPTRLELPVGRVALPDHDPCQDVDGIPCVYAGHAVNGSVHEANGCIWYELENGREVRIVWPFGYSAEFKPFVVYDNAGREVARAGLSLTAGGEGPLDGEPDSCGFSTYVVLDDVVAN